MDGLLTAMGAAAGLLVLGAGAFEALYRARDTRTIALVTRGRKPWEEVPAAPGRRTFALRLPFVNHNAAYEQTLVDVRASVRLLLRDGLTPRDAHASVSVQALTEESRSDGYWAANLLGPGERCEMELLVHVEGDPAALERLHAAVVRIAYETYGRVQLQAFDDEVVLPLAPVKPLPAPIRGETVQIQCVPTPLLTDADDIAEVIDRHTASFRQPGDIVAVAESVVAVTQRRYFRPAEVKPGFWASRLCFFVPSKGSLSSRHGFQLAMDEVGAFRMVAAFFLGALGKAVGRKGIMYEIAGRPAELIDDLTGTMPPFDKYIVAGPAQPERVVAAIQARTGMPAAIVDANDLKRAMVLAVTPGLDPVAVSRWLLDNPFGNAAEQTPIVVLRHTGPLSRWRQGAPMFRRLQYSDLDRVREIFIAAFREEYGRRGVDIGAQVTRWKRYYPLLKALAQFPNPYRYALNLHVWEEEGRIWGFIMTSPGNRDRTRWHIDFVAVAPDAQGRGIGRRIVEALFDHYGARGVKLYTLEVDQENAQALRFYDKLGFRRYASVTYYTMEAPPPPPAEPPAGFRPMAPEDAEALFSMHTACLPPTVRHIDSRTRADFAFGPPERAVAALRRGLHHQDDQRWVLEEGGHVVGWVRVLAQWRSLPHTVHLMALPGQEHQYPLLLAKAAAVLAHYPPRQVLAWASDHTPAKQQALEGWGMRVLTVDHSLVRDSLIELKLPLHGHEGLGRVEDKGFKPCFTQRS